MLRTSYPTAQFLIDLAVSSERAIHARLYPKESPMQHQPVTSTLLESIAHDGDQTLEVKFRSSGKVYRHTGVSADDFAAFQNAESHGQHYNRHIRGKFTHALVEAEPTASER